jgi:hypothetical protein
MDTDTLLSKMTRSIIEGDREQAETLALGVLDFESCQSLEKLVIDNEICGSPPPNRVEPELQGRLRAIIQADAEKNGIDALPGLD